MNGIDCATKLGPATAASLKASSIDAVGRYLGQNTWKGLTPEEVRAIHAAGLEIFLIWETDPTSPDYFSYSKGLSDANNALIEAEKLGVPDDVPIYFTVDYDAQPSDFTAIINYFYGIRDGKPASKYLVGAYGSYDILCALKNSLNAPDRYFQTYAWSHGKVCKFNDIYQYQNNVNIAGIPVDRDVIHTSSCLWMPEQSTTQPSTPLQPALNFSYPNNAQVFGDDLYIRDENGNKIPGHYVTNGDHVTVLDVSYSKQLVLLEYPTSGGVRKGYVKNLPSLIKYHHESAWRNGSTSETVFEDEIIIGLLSPWEKATPLYRRDGKLHVAYSTDKGPHTKSGYVAYNDGFSKF